MPEVTVTFDKESLVEFLEILYDSVDTFSDGCWTQSPALVRHINDLEIAAGVPEGELY